MKLIKFTTILVAAFVALALVLTSCFQNLPPASALTEAQQAQTAEDIAADPLAAMRAVLEQFPKHTTNDNLPIYGGFLNYGLMTPSPLRGVFHPVWSLDAFDGWVGERLTESLLSTDENMILSQEGMATFEADIENSTITLTLQHDVFWHDGVPLTMYDLVFSYEILAHPDYDGGRFGPTITNVIGVCEYRSGAADHISGLIVSDEGRTIAMRFHSLTPTNFYGSGIWLWPTARHHFDGIPVAEMSSHPHARHQTLGTGPFMAGSYIPGEGIQLLANPGYWQGAPRLEGINVEVIHPELVPLAMQEGRFDISGFSPQQFADFQNPSNFKYLAEISQSFSYTGFRFGRWDADTNEIDMYRTNMDNVYLRRAIAYAIDHTQLGQLMFGGLRFPATSVVPPFHAHVLDTGVPGYLHNPERARQILDEAGFIDIDGDGFRANPDGSPLVITWATMSGENDDIFTQFKIQQWAAVGLNVQLFQGRTLDFNQFYDYIEHDNDGSRIDMFDAAWSVGLAPNPRDVWGHNTVLNFTRYTSPRFREIFERMASPDMWDDDLRRQVFNDWQWAFYEEIPAIPTLWRVEPVAVNNRVRNFSLIRKDGTSQVSLGAWHLIELTRDTPYAR
ncbi:MAG: ABC transporter substrate-binding protein [Defluviitaleaceae bacterium]|nr:ABC transporter substrate-binding protein [Defluviitaleaceae bacterium]